MQVTIEIPDDIIASLKSIDHNSGTIYPENNRGIPLSKLRKCGFLAYGEAMHVFAFTILGESIYNQLTQSPPANNKP